MDDLKVEEVEVWDDKAFHFGAFVAWDIFLSGF